MSAHTGLQGSTENPAALFIAIEGIDGVGKSTFINALPRYLAQRGWNDVRIIAEFPSEYLQGNMADMIQRERGENLHSKVDDPVTQTFQFMSALSYKCNLVSKLKEKQPGAIIIVERWSYTVRVFQEYILKSGGFSIDGISIQEWLRVLTSPIIDPDLVLYLQVPEWKQLEDRLNKRGQKVAQEELDFFRGVLAGYERDFLEHTREINTELLKPGHKSMFDNKKTGMLRINANGEESDDIQKAANAVDLYFRSISRS